MSFPDPPLLSPDPEPRHRTAYELHRAVQELSRCLESVDQDARGRLIDRLAAEVSPEPHPYRMVGAVLWALHRVAKDPAADDEEHRHENARQKLAWDAYMRATGVELTDEDRANARATLEECGVLSPR